MLAYHYVPDKDALQEQLTYLVQKTRPVSLDELMRAAQSGRLLPRRSVFLTFDDADRSHLETALPLLKDRGIPAAVFVVTGVLDTDQPFWFDEVSDLLAKGATIPELMGLPTQAAIARLTEMPDAQRRTLIERLRATAPSPPTVTSPTTEQGHATAHARRPQLLAHELALFESAGIAVGNHTLSHACLDRCDESTARREIFSAHEQLTRLLGHEPLVFAYPGGFFDQQAVSLVAQAGYRLAFAYDDRLTLWPPRQPLVLSRLRGNANDSVDRLALTLSGLHAAARRLANGGRARARSELALVR